MNLLVIRFSSLGDLVLLTGIFREIKQNLPNACITFLTSLEYASLFSNNPFIDRIVTLDRKKSDVPEMFRVIREIKHVHFDHVLDFHKLSRSAFFTFTLKLLSPFRLKIHGYNKRNFFRWKLVRFKTKPTQFQRQIEAYFGLLSELVPDIRPQPVSCLYPAAAERQKVDNLLARRIPPGADVVCIAPGASHELKKWPVTYFADLINRLHTRQIVTVIIGSASDKECDQVHAWVKNRDLCINVKGKLAFLDSAEIARRCCLVLSNDSSMGHIAEAVNTPAMVLFGATVRQFGYAPFLPHSEVIETELSCRPCTTNGKGTCRRAVTLECLNRISPEEVCQRIIHKIADLKQTDKAPDRNPQNADGG